MCSSNAFKFRCRWSEIVQCMCLLFGILFYSCLVSLLCFVVFCCVCKNAWMHGCMHVCMDVRVRACMCACMYAFMHLCMRVCVHVCMYACIHVFMHACMRICVWVRTYDICVLHSYVVLYYSWYDTTQHHITRYMCVMSLLFR